MKDGKKTDKKHPKKNTEGIALFIHQPTRKNRGQKRGQKKEGGMKTQLGP